jgi:hypothetical protein
MKQKISFILSLVILCGVLGVIGMTATTAIAQEDDFGKKCNCVYPNGGVYGRIIGEDCFASDCWIEIS